MTFEKHHLLPNVCVGLNPAVSGIARLERGQNSAFFKGLIIMQLRVRVLDLQNNFNSPSVFSPAAAECQYTGLDARPLETDKT